MSKRSSKITRLLFFERKKKSLNHISLKVINIDDESSLVPELRKKEKI